MTVSSVILLSGCSLLTDAVGSALKGGGVSADANVGQAKTEGDDSVAQQANTAVSVQGGETTYQAPVESVTVNERMPWWMAVMVVLLAGWAIPSPAEMVRGLLGLFSRR